MRIDYVQSFQALSNSYEALVTYDEYNDEMEKSPALAEQVHLIEEQIGTYETIKGSLIEVEPKPENDFSEIEFYSDNHAKMYDIDSSYIDQLLGNYSANSQGVREEIEKALQKLNKTECVKEVYREILNAMDNEKVDQKEDVFVLKRRYFTGTRNQVIAQFAQEWFVSEDQLHSSAIQYMIGMNPIPNMGDIISSKDFESYKATHPEAKPFKYPQQMKRAWRQTLDEYLVPLEDELR